MESPLVAKHISLPDLLCFITRSLERSDPSSVQCALKVIAVLNSFDRLTLLQFVACFCSSYSYSLVSKINRSWAQSC